MSAGKISSGYEIDDPGYPTPEENYLTNSKGLLSWIFTLDHKRIGVMYLVGVSVAFLVAGLLAIGIRLHLMSPDGWFLETGAVKALTGTETRSTRGPGSAQRDSRLRSYAERTR